jgi:hypothetical protein
MGDRKDVCAVVRSLQRFLAFSLFLLVPVSMFAQVQTATILGAVKDSTGAVIGGASVTVTNTDTTLSRTVITEADGSYNVPALPPGNYEVKVTKDGFQTSDRKGLVLEVAQNASIDITLEVGSTSQTVTVTEAAPLVDVTSSSVGGTVNEERVADLPLNGRNWTDLALLQVGVSKVNIYAAAGNSPGLQGLKFSSNGAPVTSNQYSMDGGSQANQFGMTNSSVTGSALGVDGIKEYKTVTVLPDASYGLSMGSQTTVISKGGTNQFHGDAYDYLRNASLDARNYFDALDTANVNGFGTDKSIVFPNKRIPPFRRNDFGGAIGGPIKKDKLFFYGVYEGIRATTGLTNTKTTFPLACFVNPAGALQPVIPAQILNVNSYGTCTSEPGPTASSPNTPYLPNYNSTTHVITVNQAVLPLADLWPQPNVVGYPTFNYAFPYLQPSPENFEQGRVDYNWRSADTVFFRYTQDVATQDVATSFPQLPAEYHSAGQFASFGETHVLSPTLLNNFRFSFGRTVDFVINLPEPPAFTASNILLVPASQQQTIYGVTPKTGAYGAVSPGNGISSFATNTVAGPGNERDMFTWSDDVFWTKGKHAFKFGTLVNFFMDFTGNAYTFAGSVSFGSNANFYNGVWSNWTGSTANSIWRRDFHNKTAGWYAQDDYRVSNRVTLNLGLRYEFTTVPTEQNPAHQCAFRNPGVDLTCTPGALLENPSYLAWSPRFGFAWDVFGNGKTSIRGGAAVYYDIGNYGYLYSSNGIGDYPLSTQIIINNTAATNPPGQAFTVPFTAVLNASSTSPNSPRLGYYTRQPGSLQRALSIDQALPWQMGLTIGYVGSQGWDIAQVRDGNPVLPVGVDNRGLPIYGCWAANPANPPIAGTPYILPNSTGGCTTTGYASLGPRKNTGLATEQDNINEGNYYYNALQVQLNKRVTQGLQFQFNYTWSKLLDDGTAGLASQGATNLYQAPPGYNTLLDRGPSVYNNTNNLRVNFIYHAPTIQSDGMLSKFTNGWWFSSILAAQSGYPITPTLGSERALQSSIYSTERPDYASTYNHSSVVLGKVSEWFDPTMFSVPLAGHLGNSGRGDVTGPGLTNLDFSIVKDTKVGLLGEAGSVQFRAEMFNLLNHANFNLPTATVWSSGSPASAPAGQLGGAGGAPFATAGQITSTVGNSRQIQFALKLLF